MVHLKENSMSKNEFQQHALTIQEFSGTLNTLIIYNHVSIRAVQLWNKVCPYWMILHVMICVQHHVTTPLVSLLCLACFVFSPALAGSGLAERRLLVSLLTWAEALASLKLASSVSIALSVSAPVRSPGFVFSFSTQHQNTHVHH